MKIIVAEEAGFCFGVKRALKLISQLQGEGKRLQTFGHLVHNLSVLKDLTQKGINSVSEIEGIHPEKSLIIRTHGISKGTIGYLKKKKIQVIDATCPLVKKLHLILKKLNKELTQIVIIGDKNHPEIIAAKSYAKNPIIIGSSAETQSINHHKRISVVGQTTLNMETYISIISLLMEKTDRLDIYNTVCIATKVRQQALKKLAKEVDGVIVIGGKNSSNTNKLMNIAKKSNRNAFHIETSEELRSAKLVNKIKRLKTVGITAGASTPPEEIEKVKKILQNLNIEKEMKNGKSKRRSSSDK